METDLINDDINNNKNEMQILKEESKPQKNKKNKKQQIVRNF